MLDKLVKDALTKYRRTIPTGAGEATLTFRNNPMLSVTISRPEPFFKEVEQCWNQCHAEERDPHDPLQATVEVGDCMPVEEKKEFVSQFLYLAADATRQLQAGQDAACASLEHHAELI